jgi:hypothetical protein
MGTRFMASFDGPRPSMRPVSSISASIRTTLGQALPSHGDLTDGTRLVTLVTKIRPDEVYNLAAQSHVRVLFGEPEFTGDTTGSVSPACSRSFGSPGSRRASIT